MKLYSYDISSAYPYQASKLIDLRDCELWKATELGDREYGAYYGFVVGDFTVYPDHPLAFCSPFLADRGDGTLVNFVGTAHDYPCLWDEVCALNWYEMGEFKLDYGWFLKPMNGVRPRQPYRELMEKLYGMRGDSALRSYVVKRVMNGIIGKWLEVRKDGDGNVIEYGETYNPIYHSIVTTRTRLQVFDFIVQRGIEKDELVYVGVDGVRATRYVPLPEQADMGKWRRAGSEEAFVLSPGAVVTMSRNFKRTGYAELMVDCLSRPTASKFGKNGDIDLRKLFLLQTREFERLPRTGQELLDERYVSKPVELG